MMKMIISVLFLSMNLVLAYDFSERKPSFENPRKVIMKLSDSDLKHVNRVLGTIYNILKEYPSESLKVVVSVYGDGMRALRKDYDKDTLSRVQSLMEYDVEFVGCRNTMETLHWSEKDFIDDIEYVQAGIVEVIEKQVEGYIEATPY